MSRENRPSSLSISTPLELPISNCCRGYEDPIDVVGIVRDTKLSVYDGIATSEINKAIIMAMRARIEQHPVYSSLAARFLFNDLYKDVLGIDEFEPEFESVYRTRFKLMVEDGVKAGRSAVVGWFVRRRKRPRDIRCF